jgi:hypothetical protein
MRNVLLSAYSINLPILLLSGCPAQDKVVPSFPSLSFAHPPAAPLALTKHAASGTQPLEGEQQQAAGASFLWRGALPMNSETVHVRCVYETGQSRRVAS